MLYVQQQVLLGRVAHDLACLIVGRRLLNLGPKALPSCQSIAKEFDSIAAQALDLILASIRAEANASTSVIGAQQ